MKNQDVTAVIALRGWHPAISHTEAVYMFPEASVKRTEARRLLVVQGNCDWSRANLMSGSECVLEGGGIEKWQSTDALLNNIQAINVQNMAVECWRHEGKLPVKTNEIEKRVGELFHNAGSTFNLNNPEKRFGVILDNSAGLVAWGWMTGQGPGKHGWSAMRANKRPFFRPVSIEPRLARAAVNIASGITNGCILDPMCGTGGIVIEAALSNREALAIDFDPVMVEGTKENLDWAGVAATVVRGDSTNCTIPNNVKAVVVDPPYGRNSMGQKRLLEDTITNIVRQVGECRFVIILPTEAVETNLDEPVKTDYSHPLLTAIQAFEIPVHKSLGRLMIIAETINK